ncbi:AraC family transcriptional regulator [Aliarcobacter butzleri]|uniref:helix-turn-helix transcriptional regulator n=1 Tax=Aliarcobacter butzleri TaxID=28197 RepID=UPI00102DE8C0|nr:response regulator transcription factor [Aliarcobacter butzleri]RZV14974.1 AraC family transcriptional regulator [Aliarcobacter butzleri]
MKNSSETLSICKYIQYDEQKKREFFISSNILIFVIKGKKVLHFKNEKVIANSNDVLFLKSGNYIMSEILDEYFESILFSYDDTIILDFIKKHNLNFDEIFSFDSNYFKIKKIPIFEIFQSSVLNYLTGTSSNKESIIKLKLEKEFDFEKNILLFAKEFNMTDLAFRNKFKTIFRTTPKKWQSEKRLEKAKLLLETTNDNVTEVCYKCGFENISWFIQAFKNRYKVTPKQIKNNKN